MAAYGRKLKFVNFLKLYDVQLYIPLTYHPEIGTEASVGKSDSHLTAFIIYYFVALKENSFQDLKLVLKFTVQYTVYIEVVWKITL